jgi:hypothetical protein
MDLKTLKTLSAINNGVVLKAGKEITTISPAENLLAIHHTPSDIDFAIYDLNGFLSVLSLTSEKREIKVSGRSMEIRDGKTKLKYFGSSPDLIVTPPEDVSALTDAEYSNTFNISAEQFKQLMVAASVMNARSIVFTCDGDTVVLTTEGDYSDANSYETEFDCTSGEKCVAKLDRSTIKIPTDCDYTVSIGERAIRFESEDTDFYIVRAEI